MNVEARPPVFSAKLVLGLVVIAVGLILLADTFHWYDAWHLMAWWPLALAAFGVARIVQDGLLSFRGHVWLGFAVGGFISQFGPWGLLERWWPIFLVWGGILVTLRAIFPQPKRPRRPKRGAQPPSPPDSCDPGSDSQQVQP
ncbi:LiaI-LiaF-like domain-containing protein [Geothrix sp. 21YS21S-4]|uniref:LiaI-LiaF-like domain-containing protein n=1 Tax=Geothrix sp. 21YS21S-4 TaxID=3068889 RepID=UPI0027BA17BE|nr:DUF5668 domain-containing protein [Geothrix sp. 21YS21S-4]